MAGEFFAAGYEIVKNACIFACNFETKRVL